MELSFIFTAVRRYLWLVALLVVLGTLPGLLQRQQASTLYKAQAVLIVTPPTQNRGATISLSDPDRYVIGQLSVLQSSVLAERVATAMGGDETRETIENSVEIVHRPTTDIVDVFARAYTPERARDIADRYARMYIQDLRTRADEAQRGDAESLTAELAALQDEILKIDQTIQLKMQPFVAEATKVVECEPEEICIPAPPIPDVGIVAPAELTKRSTLVNQYTRALDNLTELQLVAKLKVTSEIVQEPVLPRLAEPKLGKKAVLAGMVAGGIIGVLAAIVLSRVSKRTINAAQVSEILGQPVVGTMTSIRTAARSRLNVLADLPSSSVAFIDELAVQAEALASVGKSLTVAVVGTERGAAATTLALALAGRYSNSGSQVLLIDADQRDPEISMLFGASKNSGVPGLLALHANRRTRGREAIALTRSVGSPFTETSVSDIRILGAGNKSDGNSLRRSNVPDVLEAASSEAHVILIDGGPVLESATTLHFCSLVDAVVLAVPVKRQSVSSLTVVARQLSASGARVLPVVTSPTRRRRSPRVPGTEPVAVSTDPTIARPVFDDGISATGAGDVRAVDLGETSRPSSTARPGAADRLSRRSVEERVADITSRNDTL